VTEPLSESDLQTLKTAAFGAVYLVSNADPGFFSMLRESFAASGALSSGKGVVRQVLTTGGLPTLPRQPREAVEAVVLPALRKSVAILREKAPEELADFRTLLLDAVERVAAATGGVTEAEAAALDKIRAALNTEETKPERA
jgi:hypothetical protein